MSRLTTSRIQMFVIMVSIAAIAGALDAYVFPNAAEASLRQGVLHGGIIWCIGGSLVWSFELFWIPSRHGIAIRRQHFLIAIVVKSLILVAIVFLLAVFSRGFLHDLWGLDFLGESTFYRTLSFVFLLTIIFQTILQIVRIIGGRNLINFVLGKYHRPVSEDTIFMFLDMNGSTALAERLGDVGVYSMITKFFFDITGPIIENGGEIHRYVGDQVVVTWPLKSRVENLRAIKCSFAIAQFVESRAKKYQLEFGAVPGFRIGLHGGPVVISQCGDQKQEISYFGDTVNMAARIEQQCKALNCTLLISGELLRQIALPTEFEIHSKGSVQLRGREQETALFTVINAGV